MDELVIGFLGGMGTYATINAFKQYAEIFPATKEWERPRIVIDNRCTMPSRVRAFLYNEKLDELVNEMADSMSNLVKTGCNKIILACNTSHLFLPKIYEKVPELEQYIVNIIDSCVSKIKEENIKEIYLIASEGTIESKVYQNALKKEEIKCLYPKKSEFNSLRLCIEAVKQNKYDEDVKNTYLDLVNRHNYCILGCTELPILNDMYKEEVKSKTYDPVLLALMKIKENFKNE